MIIYVAALTALLSFLMLALVYLADLWEREPLDLIQNAFLVGLGSQLVMVLGLHQAIAIEAWSGWFYLLTLAALAIVLPILLAAEQEVDERFDGIVYAVTFTVGAAAVVHLFNLPGAAAWYPEHVALAGGATPDARDLLLLVGSPGLRHELADLLALVLVAVLAGAVLGTLKLQGRRLVHQIGGTLLAALLVGGIELAADGWLPVRLALALAAVVAAIALKRRSVFRHRQPPPEREIFLGALKTGIMILGAIVLALAMLMGMTGNWQAISPTADPSRIEHGSNP